MKYLTTAAMALALAASAAAASADPPDNNKGDHPSHAAGGQPPQHSGGPPTGQPHGGPPPGGAPHSFTPQGPVHAGPPAGAQNFNGQAAGGNTFHGNGQTFHGNGQSGGAGPQNYRGYGRGPGGYVAPNGQAATGGQTGQPQFHGGNGIPNGATGGGQVHGHFNGAPGAQVQGGQVQGGQVQGSGQFHHGGNPGFNGAPRGGIPGADRSLRGRDQGRGWYNAGRFPQQFHAQNRYHVGWNNRPHGWYQRTWGYGDFLPFGWYAPSFYLDFQDYGLAYPPVGCEWVREGADAVLVNVWTGEVLSVAYGVFW
jgi:Ni/Co efflux regulator RcnB